MHGSSPADGLLPVATFGGLVSLAPAEALPDGASPRTWNTDYLVGQVKTRDGLTNVYNQSDSTVGPSHGSAASSADWNNPDGLLSNASYSQFGPVSTANSAQVTGFNFALDASSNITGAQVTLTAYSSVPANLEVSLISGGAVIATKTVALQAAVANLTLGSMTDLWGLKQIQTALANAVTFGVQVAGVVSGGFTLASVYVQNVQVQLGVNTGQQTMQPFSTFTDQDGQRYNLVLDQGGNLWVESLDTAPGSLALSRTGIAPGSLGVAVEGEGVEYIAFVKPLIPGGSDMPLQWSPQWTDRITQVGPGVAPTFTPSQASTTNYAITAITQPAQKQQSYSYFLQSLGAGNTSPGMVVTIYYLDATVAPGPDPDLVAAVNSGYPVYLWASYVYGASKTPIGDPNLTAQVVGPITLGEGQPPGQPHNYYYFQFVLTAGSPAYNFSDDSSSLNVVTYQRTLATLVTADPVPNLAVNSQMVVTGVTPAAWNSTWTVQQTPNASEMVITGSQVGGSLGQGVAQFNYAVTNGTNAPAVGQIVIITNTLNGSGALNGTWTIAAVSGGDTGTFQVQTSLPDASFQTENGLASTEGTIFAFDPGANNGAGSTTDPIYGNATAFGDVVFNASGIFVDPGTYQGTVFFILRDGSYTFPAPPTTFTVPDNTTQIVVTNIPIGPPNVVGRGISLTEAGQNGVPGANFFTLPNPVTFYNEDKPLTATSFFVNDNTSVSVTLFFTSIILNSATAIDVYGYNLFNLIEIGDPSYISNYDARNVYGQPLNKVQNFINLSFDGGYLQSATPVPAGWTQPDQYGSLQVSPVFGNSYYILNSTSATLTQAGLIQQTAYQDYNNVPIVNAQRGYSVRATVRCPSGITTQGGSLVFALVAGSAVLGTYTVPLSSLTTAFTRVSGVLLADPGVSSVPSTLVLQVYAADLPAGADVELDRFDVFPTDVPVLLTTEYWSYSGLPTMVDAVTGQVIYTSENQQPVQAATTLYDTHYVMKAWTGEAPGSSLYSLQASGSLEPADWNEPEVAQRSGGAVGPFAWAGGEQWFVAVSRAGLYLYAGGAPGKISQEIQQVWDAVNWDAAQSIWVHCNLRERRLMIGVPMTTPNYWAPFAPAVTNPTSPNVILMLNFNGVDSGEELKVMAQMHTTMFGKLAALDMRRKWSLWYGGVESPGAATVMASGGEQVRLGNGMGTSQVYYLDPTQSATDNGAPIDSGYTTAGLPLLGSRAEIPQLGPNRVQWDYIVAALLSGGLVGLRLLSGRLFFPEPANYIAWKIPGGFAPGLEPVYDTEASLNFIGSRTFFEFRQNDGNQGWTLSNLVLRGRKAVWNAFMGRK